MGDLYIYTYIFCLPNGTPPTSILFLKKPSPYPLLSDMSMMSWIIPVSSADVQIKISKFLPNIILARAKSRAKSRARARLELG